jgi:hypothetical protein
MKKLYESIYPFLKVIGLWRVLWSWGQQDKPLVAVCVINHGHMDQLEVKE